MNLNLLWVGAGGFVGSVLRYLIYLLTRSTPSLSVPVGTLAVNVIGCFLIGILTGLVEKQHLSNPGLLLFLSTGILGGFTTFSAFGLETSTFMRNQQFIFATLNIILNLILGLSAVFLGRLITSFN